MLSNAVCFTLDVGNYAFGRKRRFLLKSNYSLSGVYLVRTKAEAFRYRTKQKTDSIESVFYIIYNI